MASYKSSQKMSRTSYVVLCLVLLLVGFGIGFLGGFFAHKPDTSHKDFLLHLTKGADETIAKKLSDEVNAENIRTYLKHLTSTPHLAGTPADLATAEELRDFWLHEAGLDRVQLYPFDVLLSYPEKDDPNRIVIKDGGDETLFTSQLYEKILRPEQNQSDVVPPFNAYSAAGEPEGDLVYVNYARVDDFIELTETHGIDPAGHICIARYGKIFRGDKTKFAEEYGCIGLILYSDPANYVVDGEEVYPDSWSLPGSGVQRGNVKQSQGLGDPATPGYPAAKFASQYGCVGLILYNDPADYAPDGQTTVYPDSWFLPGTGVQRGTLYLDGDPLTPGYPSLKSAYRLAVNETGLPTIPVQPIGYDDARVFLSNMTGPEVPADWQGKLNITYRMGPGFTNTNWKAQMFVNTFTKNVTTYNVLGFIEGDVEPDRYVMLGNHRDAWVFGALDPSSGTAAMMELSRAYGAMIKTGWRPRRTIVFCSWGAEEHGIIGTREWVEFYGKMLSERTVAYLNVDIAVQGTFSLRGKTLPMFHQLMYVAAKEVPNPDPAEVAAGRETVYDTWLYRQPGSDVDGVPTGLPRIQSLGSGSDFAPFVTKVGVTCVDLRYNFDPSLGLSSYPLYHSIYETFHLAETYYDPQFKYHQAVSRYWGELARRLADENVLPFDVVQYGRSLDDYVVSLRNNYGDLLQTNAETGLNYLTDALSDFKEATVTFTEAMSEVNIENPLEVRRYNDMMMQLERMFIDPNGLPGRPLIRNVVFAPSQHNSYAGSTFPGLTDSLYELSRASPGQQADKAEVVKQQLAILTYFIDAAATSLKDVLL